ncbi:hypothetical protein GCM10008941_06460 [Rhizomicrobium palustre]
MRYHYATPALAGLWGPAFRAFSPEEARLYPIAWLKGKGSFVPSSSKSPEKRERLAAALRENLKKRKIQARGRGENSPSGADSGAPQASEGAADSPESKVS